MSEPTLTDDAASTVLCLEALQRIRERHRAAAGVDGVIQPSTAIAMAILQAIDERDPRPLRATLRRLAESPPGSPLTTDREEIRYKNQTDLMKKLGWTSGNNTPKFKTIVENRWIQTRVVTIGASVQKVATVMDPRAYGPKRRKSVETGGQP